MSLCLLLRTSFTAANVVSCSLIWSVSVAFSDNLFEVFPSSSSCAFSNNAWCRFCIVCVRCTFLLRYKKKTRRKEKNMQRKRMHKVIIKMFPSYGARKEEYGHLFTYEQSRTCVFLLLLKLLILFIKSTTISRLSLSVSLDCSSLFSMVLWSLSSVWLLGLYITCKWFHDRSKSLIEFSVSLTSLCINAYSVFNCVCNALYPLSNADRIHHCFCVCMWKEWNLFFS